MRNLTLLLLLLLKINTVNAQIPWTNLNTGINDNLHGVTFLQSNGITCGEHGLYYTTNGGTGASSWTRLQIADPTLSAIYENTKFTNCFINPANTTDNGYVYACGQDLSTNKAVILKIAVPAMTCQLKYSGAVNSKINKIDYDTYLSKYLAVGDHGLLISFSDSSTVSTIATGFTDDLTSISFDSYLLLGSYGKIRATSVNGSSLGSITQATIPDTPILDISGQYSVGGDNSLATDFSTTPPTVLRKTYYQGPLNMNCVFDASDFILVGTDHGIYSAHNQLLNTFTSYALELQPETTSYQINEFSRQNAIANLYACGNNGVILTTATYGGPTKPYVAISSTDGGCYTDNIQLAAVYGTVSSAQWFSNGQLIHTGTLPFTYFFSSPGNYTISVVVQNSDGLQNTDSANITLVAPPDITKVATLSKTILCKLETIQVQVANSEPNVIYSLNKEGDSSTSFGQSVISTGGTLTFDATIDLTGNYYVDAKSSMANCERRFPGNFLITVEETKADFHSGLINARVNEAVDFYQNAVDSQNYEWQFGPTAAPGTSNLPDAQASFTTPGQASVSLHSWSNLGCNDTETQNVPYVYQTPATQDDCFLLINNSDDPQSLGYEIPDISQMIPTTNGYFICGTYDHNIFASRYGITLNLAGKQGGYLAKHDQDGVLRWVVYTVNDIDGTFNSSIVYSTAEDSNGDIYISGRGSGKFYDNAGHVTDLAQTPIGITDRYYLIKLNSKGELIWYMQNYVFGFIKLAIDHENNLIALSNFVTNYVSPQLFFNGVQGQLIGQQITPMDEDATNEIIKFNPQGTVIWDTKLNLYSANERELTNVGIDSSNDIYVTMSYDISATIYQVGTTATQTLYGDGSYGGKIGLVKFNKYGQIIWKTRSGTANSANISVDSTIAQQMIVDDDGTVYITGNNFTGNNTAASTSYTHVIVNTNSTVTTTTNGPYFVAKINSAGVCQWLRGAGNTYYGYGYKVFKSNNEIYTVGMMSNNGADSCSGTIDSTDGHNYNLTIGASDYFIAVYDLSGNLKRVFVNGENPNALYFDNMTGFFKEGNYFYLSKNLGYYDGETGYVDFGNSLPSLNGKDGTIVRFTEGCAVLKYDAALSNSSFNTSLLDEITIAPNPTNNHFTVKLNTTFENITLIITDITGKMISEEAFSNVSEIQSTVKGQTGIYFVKLKTQEGEKNFKLIKY